MAKVDEGIAQIHADQEAGNCEICHKPIEDYTSKKNKTYKANVDHSPHRTKNTKGDYVCVKNWDEFKVSKGQEAEAVGSVTAPGLEIVVDEAMKPTLEDFRKLLQEAWLFCFDLAKQTNPGADDRGTRITANGYVHDFFNYYHTVRKV